MRNQQLGRNIYSYISFRTSSHKFWSGGAYNFLSSIVSGEILSSYCEGLRNAWCTPTAGWLNPRNQEENTTIRVRDARGDDHDPPRLTPLPSGFSPSSAPQPDLLLPCFGSSLADGKARPFLPGLVLASVQQRTAATVGRKRRTRKREIQVTAIMTTTTATRIRV